VEVDIDDATMYLHEPCKLCYHRADDNTPRESEPKSPATPAAAATAAECDHGNGNGGDVTPKKADNDAVAVEDEDQVEATRLVEETPVQELAEMLFTSSPPSASIDPSRTVFINPKAPARCHLRVTCQNRDGRNVETTFDTARRKYHCQGICGHCTKWDLKNGGCVQGGASGAVIEDMISFDDIVVTGPATTTTAAAVSTAAAGSKA
jgi:hypothetical protein